MKQIFRKNYSGSVKTLFLICGLFLCLMVSTTTKAANDNYGQADIRINADGTLFVDIIDQPLKSVLQDIADKAGFRVSLYGVEDTYITKRFKNEPLEKGIRKIVEPRSISFLYQTDPLENSKQTQKIKIVWVFDSIGGVSESTMPVAQNVAFRKTGGTAPEEDESEHATLKRPKIRLDYDLNSEEGFWVDRIMNASERKQREEAIAELVKIDTDSAIAAISLAFNDKDPRTRMCAVDNLAKSQNPLSEQLIGQALHKDDESQVAISAARELYGRDSQVAYEFLYSASFSHKYREVWLEVNKMLYPRFADKIK